MLYGGLQHAMVEDTLTIVSMSGGIVADTSIICENAVVIVEKRQHKLMARRLQIQLGRNYKIRTIGNKFKVKTL